MENGENKQRKRKFRYRRIVFPIIVLFAATVLLMAAGVFVCYKSRIGVNKGKIEYCLQGDELQISWQSGADKSRYRLSRYDAGSEDYVFCGEYAGGGARLTGVEAGRELAIKIQGVRTVSLFGHNMEILGEARILTVVPAELNCPVLTKDADPKKGNVKITWDAEPDSSYEVYLMNESGTLELYSEVESGEISFSMENSVELAGRDQVLGLAVRAMRREEDYTLYGPLSNMVVMERADLMEDEIHLTCQDNGERQYTLTWQEGKGDWYELQEWSFTDKEWISRQTYRWSDELSYETGRLPSCTKVRFRVITYNDAELRDKGIFAAEPSEVTFRTERSPLYCTVWPLTALNISEDAAGENVTGQVPAGKALCVLEEKNGYFFVRYGDEYGYIDSRYCLIDLAEYLGNLCEYNITNSYESIFDAHGYEIPEITGTVVKGYENIHLTDGGTLVPYLYPCAQKLYEAALLVEQDGYCLRIYDAFRPHEATRYLYDTFEVLLDEPVPEQEEAGGGLEQRAEQPVDEQTERIKLLLGELDPGTAEILKRLSGAALTALRILPQESLANITLITSAIARTTAAEAAAAGAAQQGEAALPQDQAAEDAALLQGLAAEDIALLQSLTAEDIALLQSLPAADIPVLKGLTGEELEAVQVYLVNILTYRALVTDNRYKPSNFLSATISAHNRGIALDLTLHDIAAEKDVEMQTDIHDLSWYSSLEENNENADLLASYMTGVGYKDLFSEWWHFQDNETRYELDLGYLEEGVSPEGWKKDDRGWKYRAADGSYYCACTVTIEEKERTFNEKGYLVEQ